MPQLGETVTEGTITRWLKQVGDPVAEDDVLFEVSTDKVDSEVPSPVSGFVTEILVEEGETVDVGTKLAVISDQAPSAQGQSGPSAARSNGQAGSGAGVPAPPTPAPPTPAPPTPAPPIAASPTPPSEAAGAAGEEAEYEDVDEGLQGAEPEPAAPGGASAAAPPPASPAAAAATPGAGGL